MGTGIGKDCLICENQLTMDRGYNSEETLCRKCEELIPKVLKYLASKT
jgi:hypothetical protein